jgi:soluble lytic murein transglycosylase-like protein
VRESRSRVVLWASFGLGFLLAAALQQPWRSGVKRHADPLPATTLAAALIEVNATSGFALGEELVVTTAQRYGIDPALVLAVIVAESGNDPGAVSAKGAVGLMQILPDTAALVGVPSAHDSASNIEAGCRYLGGLLASFGGDVELALAAYNAGPGAVRRWGTVPPYRETREFVRRVGATYRRLTGLDLGYATRLTSDASTLF